MSDEGTAVACEAVRPLLAAYARGDVAPDREEGFREHLAGCPACRAALSEADPAAIFQELRGGALPEGFWREFDRTLRARLAREEQRGWRWSAARDTLGSMLRPPRLAYVAAPLAMVFLLGVTLYVSRPGLFSPGARTQRPEEGLRSPYERPMAPPRVPAGPGAGRDRAFPPAAAPVDIAAATAAEPPPLEEVRSPAARVYRLDIAGEDPTPIYMVVDETIDF